jgi:hydrogenase maturation protease
MTIPSTRILIAGIGNIFFGDDAFGCEVVRRLAARVLPRGVQVVDFGIRGMDLAYALGDEQQLTILVDAVSRGAPPGTLYIIQPELDGETRASPDVHSLKPEAAIRLARDLAGTVRPILLVGCEPSPLDECDDIQSGLSRPVEEALEEAIAWIEILLARQLEWDIADGQPVDLSAIVAGLEAGLVAQKEPSS